MEKLPITDAETVQFTKIVRSIKFFANINLGVLEKILARVNYYKCGKGEKVCRQGDPGDAFYVINEGKLRVSIREAFFFSKTLAELGRGACFGEMALLTREPRSADVTCVEESRLFVLTVDDFDNVLAGNPTFAAEIRKIASDREFELRHKK